MNRYEVIFKSGRRVIVNATDLTHLEHIMAFMENKEPWASIKPYESMARAIPESSEKMRRY